MKLGIAGGVLLVLAIIAAIVGYSSLFTVYQTRLALVVRLGQPVRVVTEPGLNFKIPYVESRHTVELRERAFAKTYESASRDPMELNVSVALN